MLFLAETLLNAAGFRYDRIEDTWAVPVPLCPVLMVETEADGSHIMEALLEIHAALETCGCTYSSSAIHDGYLSIVGLSRAKVAAVA
jgi:hypothetical protein